MKLFNWIFSKPKQEEVQEVHIVKPANYVWVPVDESIKQYNKIHHLPEEAI